MKLEVGKFYKTREGRKAEGVYVNRGLRDIFRVSYIIEEEGQLFSCNLDGYYHDGRAKSPLDLISEWVELLRVTGWYNIHQYRLVGPYDTKEDAESSASGYVLGRIYIDQEVGK